MATTLRKKPQLAPISNTHLAALSKDPLPPFTKESELCELFIREFNTIDGWTCYPEAAGFDVLVVHQDGRQIGVEAKLTLNAKVADQILPNQGDDYFSKPGPDHRLVIACKIPAASAGIAKMLSRLGVTVITPQSGRTKSGYAFSFHLNAKVLFHESAPILFGRERLFDWNPAERCRVPAMATNLPAGIPSPVKLTPWKEAALKVIALMRQQGFITAKQIAHYGMGSSRWTQHSDKPAWLRKGNARGQWVETEHMPAFDKQHPELYAYEVAATAAHSQAQ